MKIIDYINLAINAGPSLFIMENYEESSFAVLHHTFIVLGNGMEWADTGNSKTGGYLVDPIYREVNSDWIRIKDRPYGEEKHDLGPKVFKEDIFYFKEIDQELTKGKWVYGKPDFIVVFKSELDELKKKYNVLDNNAEYIPGFHTHCYHLITKHSSRENPYPNFSKHYSCFWNIDPTLIQKDWRLSGINHLKYWQQYFDNKDRVKGYHYYKNPKELEKWVINRYKNRPEKFPDWVQAVRDNYEIQEFNGENYEEMASVRWEKELKNTKSFLSETIQRLSIQ